MNHLDEIIAVSAVRDREMYARCVKENPNFAGCKLVMLDNTKENLGVSVRYNQFLDGFDMSRPAWIVFCHEDLELVAPVAPRMADLDKDCLWGTAGARKRPLLPGLCRWQMAGVLTEIGKDGGERVERCHPCAHGKCLDTLDCLLMAVHSSVIARHHLRFDERCQWDLYVEDFCIQADKHGVRTKYWDFPVVHHSRRLSVPDSYRETLIHLNEKYPDDCYAGTCSWIGGDTLQRHLLGGALFLARRFLKTARHNDLRG